MPFYDYKCKTGHSWEVMKAFSEYDREELCEICKEQGERQMSGGQRVIYKTNGVYETDFKGK
jgi:putative FmdB family regulatory protein